MLAGVGRGTCSGLSVGEGSPKRSKISGACRYTSKSIRGSIGKGVVDEGSGTGFERLTRSTSEREAGGFFFNIFFLFLVYVNFSVALFSVLTFCFTLLVSEAFDLEEAWHLRKARERG